MAGTKIYDAALLGSIEGTEKVPVGNGGSAAVAVTIDQIAEHANGMIEERIETVETGVSDAKTTAAAAKTAATEAETEAAAAGTAAAAAAAAAKAAQETADGNTTAIAAITTGDSERDSKIEGLETDVADLQTKTDELMFAATGYDTAAYVVDDLSAVAAETYGSADIAEDWTPYLLDTTDNANETTTPAGALNKANYLRYEDGSFAPTVGITEEMRAACDVALYDESGNLVYEAGAYDAEAEWETDKALIVAGGYAESAARKLFTDSGATTEVAHKLRPWETVETKYSIGIGLPYTVYLLDNLVGNSGRRWKGLFKTPMVWDGIDVTPYKLVPTAIMASPVCTVGGAARSFFYLYEGETNCAGEAGNGGGCTMFSGGRTYPNSSNIQQVRNMQYARANNADTTKPYPFAEGGFHAWNVFMSSQEIYYKTKYLSGADMFGSGISSNNSPTNESTWKLYGGVRYKLTGSDTWLYCAWSNSSHGIYYDATPTRTNMSQTINYERAKEQVMESQMALSYAVETGVAADTEFEFYGGTYWYENVTGALGVADGRMNARVYKKVSQTFSAYDSTGAEASWDAEVVLRMSLMDGMRHTGDIYTYRGGGCEMLGTAEHLQTESRTGNPVRLYVQFDQTKWHSETTASKADGGVFDFESDYIKVGEYTNLGGSWTALRVGYTPWKSEKGGGISSGECFYTDDNDYWASVLNTVYRLALRVGGTAPHSYCSGRSLNASYAASSAYRCYGGSAQALINVQQGATALQAQ